MKDSRITSLALAVAPWTTLAACAGLAVADVVLSVLTPGYDAVSETSSQLMSEGARYSALARVTLGLYGVLLAPLALLLWREFVGRQVVRFVAVAGMLVHIIAATVAAVALNDSDSLLIGQLTANDIHDRFAIVMFAAVVPLLVAMAAAGTIKDNRRVVVQAPSPQRRLGLFTWAVLAAVLLSGVLFQLEVLVELNGVLERTTAAVFMVWMAVFAMLVRWTPKEPTVGHGPDRPE